MKEGTQLLKQAQSSRFRRKDKLKTDLREVQVAQNKADAAYANKTIAYAEYTQIKETLRLGESQIQQQLRLIEVERRRQTAKQSLGIFGAGVDVATEFAKNVFSIAIQGPRRHRPGARAAPPCYGEAGVRLLVLQYSGCARSWSPSNSSAGRLPIGRTSFSVSLRRSAPSS